MASARLERADAMCHPMLKGDVKTFGESSLIASPQIDMEAYQEHHPFDILCSKSSVAPLSTM